MNQTCKYIIQNQNFLFVSNNLVLFQWKKMVDKFCKDEKKTKGKHYECCDKKKGEELYSCFTSAAPDPAYNITNVPPPTIESFCDIHTSLQSM